MLWYINTMECYSVKKRNEFESVLVRWMNQEFVIQSEVSQKGKQMSYVYTHTHTHTHIYMESRKMVLMSLFVGNKW